MTLNEFNALSENEGRQFLLACCHSQNWANGVLAGRPYPAKEKLFEQELAIWKGLKPQDWLEAFAAHPKIGEVKTPLAAKEQAGVNAATDSVKSELALLNHEYEKKFGFIYIVCATGKSAGEMLEILRRRLQNTKEQEIQNAAHEQSLITRLRLEKNL